MIDGRGHEVKTENGCRRAIAASDCTIHMEGPLGQCAKRLKFVRTGDPRQRVYNGLGVGSKKKTPFPDGVLMSILDPVIL